MEPPFYVFAQPSDTARMHWFEQTCTRAEQSAEIKIIPNETLKHWTDDDWRAYHEEMLSPAAQKDAEVRRVECANRRQRTKDAWFSSCAGMMIIKIPGLPAPLDIPVWDPNCDDIRNIPKLLDEFDHLGGRTAVFVTLVVSISDYQWTGQWMACAFSKVKSSRAELKLVDVLSEREEIEETIEEFLDEIHHYAEISRQLEARIDRCYARLQFFTTQTHIAKANKELEKVLARRDAEAARKESERAWQEKQKADEQARKQKDAQLAAFTLFCKMRLQDLKTRAKEEEDSKRDQERAAAIALERQKRQEEEAAKTEPGGRQCGAALGAAAAVGCARCACDAANAGAADAARGMDGARTRSRKARQRSADQAAAARRQGAQEEGACAAESRARETQGQERRGRNAPRARTQDVWPNHGGSAVCCCFIGLARQAAAQGVREGVGLGMWCRVREKRERERERERETSLSLFLKNPNACSFKK